MSPLKSIETQEAPAAAGSRRKGRPDLYTVLLVIALVAILIAIVFLYLEMAVYDFKLKGGPPVGMVTQTGDRGQRTGIRGVASSLPRSCFGGICVSQSLAFSPPFSVFTGP